MLRKLAWVITLLVLLAITAAMASPFPVSMLIKQPKRVYAFVTSEPLMTLTVPVQGVTQKQLSDTWGAARSGGRKHEGIDIFAKRDTPVLSATEGFVVHVGENTLGGRTVWVLGPGRERHYYAHLERYNDDIEKGQWIEPGTVLGYVGDSGNAKGTPPHLHYGIYRTGEGALNPYPRLR